MKEFLDTIEFGGWSVDYDYASKLCEVLVTERPNCILDLGSGVTTRIFDHYSKLYGGDVYTVESDSFWFSKIQNQISGDSVHLILTPAEITSDESRYPELGSLIQNQVFDLVSVDGPIGFMSKSPRTNILELLSNNQVSAGGHIFIHDTNRDGESRLVDQVLDRGCEIVYEGRLFKVLKKI